MASPADVARRNAFRRQLLKFADERLPGTCGDLQAYDQELAHLLSESLENLRSEEYEKCIYNSQQLRKRSWAGRNCSNDSRYGGSGNNWPHVSYKEAFVFSLLFSGCANLCTAPQNHQEALEALDTSVIFSGVLPPTRSMLQYCEPLVKQLALADGRYCIDGLTWRIPCQPPESAPPIQHPVATEHQPELRVFAEHVRRNEALKMTGVIDQWPAISEWGNLEYLARNFGHRHIPVEIGRHGSHLWREEVMLFSRLLVDYMVPCNTQLGVAPPLERIAYLAQHPLFEHIPTMRHDVAVPHYAKQFLSAGEPHMNAWVGTAGTVTPLHTDTYDNILAQVAGFKYVRLYDKSQTPFLYVDESPGARGNMSLVHCENEDFDKHPLLSQAKYTELILGPGDCLFIPSGCWHYVRSLTASVSVNFWFT